MKDVSKAKQQLPDDSDNESDSIASGSALSSSESGSCLESSDENKLSVIEEEKGKK